MVSSVFLWRTEVCSWFSADCSRQQPHLITPRILPANRMVRQSGFRLLRPLFFSPSRCCNWPIAVTSRFHISQMDGSSLLVCFLSVGRSFASRGEFSSVSFFFSFLRDQPLTPVFLPRKGQFSLARSLFSYKVPCHFLSPAFLRLLNHPPPHWRHAPPPQNETPPPPCPPPPPPWPLFTPLPGPSPACFNLCFFLVNFSCGITPRF